MTPAHVIIPFLVSFLIMTSLALPVRFRHLGAILLPLPVATNLLIWTNPFHHLFRIAPRIDKETAAFPILVNDYGPWFYRVHVPFMYLLFFVSVLLLVNAVFSRKGLYRNQILILLIALLIPLASDIINITGYSPTPNFNLSGILFSVSGLLIAFSLKRQKFLDLMPAARSAFIQSMEDGWIVLDPRGRFQDLNPVAEKMLGRPAGTLMGRPAEEFRVSLPAWQQLLSATENRSVETRKLQGMLPICAHCKNIRDDEGYWHQVESYVTRHSDATFSHGICPDFKT